MATYRKKYINIEAVRWWYTSECASEDGVARELYRLRKFVFGVNGDENSLIDFGVKEINHNLQPVLWLKNCNGMRIVNPGDYVLKTPTGCVYPLDPVSFNMSYEPLAKEANERQNLSIDERVLG